MKKLAPALALLTAVLAVPHASAALHRTSACGDQQACFYLCGAHDCATTTNPVAMRLPMTYDGFLKAAAPVGPQPYYRISSPIRPGENTSAQPVYYVPHASLIRLPGGKHTFATWVRLSRVADAALRAVADQAAPYPTPTLTHVIVDHSLANDPNSYLRLWTIGNPVASAAGAGGWLPINVAGDQASPWTDGLITLAISRHGAFLNREGRVYAIPAPIAARARAGRSLRG